MSSETWYPAAASLWNPFWSKRDGDDGGLDRIARAVTLGAGHAADHSRRSSARA